MNDDPEEQERGQAEQREANRHRRELSATLSRRQRDGLAPPRAETSTSASQINRNTVIATLNEELELEGWVAHEFREAKNAANGQSDLSAEQVNHFEAELEYHEARIKRIQNALDEDNVVNQAVFADEVRDYRNRRGLALENEAQQLRDQGAPPDFMADAERNLRRGGLANLIVLELNDELQVSELVVERIQELIDENKSDLAQTYEPEDEEEELLERIEVLRQKTTELEREKEELVERIEVLRQELNEGNLDDQISLATVVTKIKDGREKELEKDWIPSLDYQYSVEGHTDFEAQHLERLKYELGLRSDWRTRILGEAEQHAVDPRLEDELQQEIDKAGDLYEAIKLWLPEGDAPTFWTKLQNDAKSRWEALVQNAGNSPNDGELANQRDEAKSHYDAVQLFTRFFERIPEMKDYKGETNKIEHDKDLADLLAIVEKNADFREICFVQVTQILGRCADRLAEGLNGFKRLVKTFQAENLRDFPGDLLELATEEFLHQSLTQIGSLKIAALNNDSESVETMLRIKTNVGTQRFKMSTTSREMLNPALATITKDDLEEIGNAVQALRDENKPLARSTLQRLGTAADDTRQQNGKTPMFEKTIGALRTENQALAEFEPLMHHLRRKCPSEYKKVDDTIVINKKNAQAMCPDPADQQYRNNQKQFDEDYSNYEAATLTAVRYEKDAPGELTLELVKQYKELKQRLEDNLKNIRNQSEWKPLYQQLHASDDSTKFSPEVIDNTIEMELQMIKKKAVHTVQLGNDLPHAVAKTYWRAGQMEGIVVLSPKFQPTPEDYRALDSSLIEKFKDSTEAEINRRFAPDTVKGKTSLGDRTVMKIDEHGNAWIKLIETTRTVKMIKVSEADCHGVQLRIGERTPADFIAQNNSRGASFRQTRG